MLVWSARHPDANGLTNIWWFVFAYFVLEVGEMLLSPIGLSAVTELSVPSVVSLMMGGWFLGTSYSEVVAAELGKLSSIEIPEGELEVSLLCEKVAVERIDGAATYSQPGRPIAAVSNIMLEYRPGTPPKPVRKGQP